MMAHGLMTCSLPPSRSSSNRWRAQAWGEQATQDHKQQQQQQTRQQTQLITQAG
jgi:hypothetical protein